MKPLRGALNLAGTMRRVLASLLLFALPDQRALIHFTDGAERLVIETRFTGQGTQLQ